MDLIGENLKVNVKVYQRILNNIRTSLSVSWLRLTPAQPSSVIILTVVMTLAVKGTNGYAMTLAELRAALAEMLSWEHTVQTHAC